MNTLKYGLAVIVAGAALVQPQVNAQEGNGNSWRSLEGVWLVRLAPKVCATGAPVPVPPTLNLFTFHEGGTMSGSLQNYAISATNRTLSHGLWSPNHAGGQGEYQVRFIHLRYDFATGVFIGSQDAQSALVLNAEGNAFTADSSTTGIDANGNVAYRNCATLTGERVQLP